MKIFVVQWWNILPECKWQQEYYTSVTRAAARVKMLQEDISSSDATIETVEVDTDD